MRIGIVGGGFVGSATALLKCNDITVIIYDLDPARCSPPGCTKEDLRTCDLVFVCVPTPSYDSGECNTIIVERAIAGLKEIGIRARADIERALGAKIFLGLHIKVSKEWQKDPKLLAKLGFGEKS